MRNAFLVVAPTFCLGFGGMTAAVAAQSGLDIFILVSFLIVLMLDARACSARCETRRALASSRPRAEEPGNGRWLMLGT